MGFYLQTDSNHGKARKLVQQYGGQILPDQPKSFKDTPEGKALICVIDNGAFEAAAYIYNEGEFEDFKFDYSDDRPRTWVLLDNLQAVRDDSNYTRATKAREK